MLTIGSGAATPVTLLNFSITQLLALNPSSVPA
jgi:hypothetical protein